MAQLIVQRCHDATAIERILVRDAFDEPIPYFPRGFLRYTTRVFLATSPRVYVITAELDGQYAGFALGQTYGPDMWRRFARQQLMRHPLSIARVVWQLKVVRPLGRKLRRRTHRRRSDEERPQVTPATALDVPRIDRPFAWSIGRPDTGQVDQLFVPAERRGHGLAQALLRRMASEMGRDGISLLEAHVDAWNEPSLRAFLNAGFQAWRTSGGDFYVSCDPRTSGSMTTSGSG